MYRSSAFASCFLRLCCGYTLYRERINDNKASLLYVKRVFSLSESPKKNNKKRHKQKKKQPKNTKKADSLSTFSLFSLFSLSALQVCSFSSSSSSSSSFGCRVVLVVSLSFGA